MKETDRYYGYNRNNMKGYTPKNGMPARGGIRFDRKMAVKIANQFIVSAFIALIIVIISNINVSFLNKAVDGTKWAAGTNYDFKVQADKLSQYISNGINSRIKSVQGTTGNLLKKSGAVSTSDTLVMIMPVDGNIISAFAASGSSSKVVHNGIDISGEEGTPIKAALGGTVEKIEQDKSMGRTVRIRHDGGLETVYSHCSEVLVDENQKVEQGECIAKVGHTGEVSAPMLYFEVYKDGKVIDPVSVIGTAVELR